MWTLGWLKSGNTDGSYLGSYSSFEQGCQVGIFKAKFQKFGVFESCLACQNGVWHVGHSLAFFSLF